MHAQKYRPIEASCAWKGAEMRNKTDWLRLLSTAKLREIDAALQSVKSRGIDLFDVGKADFPLPGFSQGLVMTVRTEPADGGRSFCAAQKINVRKDFA